ncbi:unnamed protein product, partial [marine sediment metagenome]
TWTSTLERKLRDTFEVTFTRAGLSPRRFMPEYRLELPSIKTLTTQDDMIKAVEALARELVETEKARKIRPPRVRPPPPERLPPRPPRIITPPEDEEVFIGVPIIPKEFPEYPRKGFIPSRRLTALERDEIWDIFSSKIYLCGKRPEYFKPEFDEWLGNYLFNSWEGVKRNFSDVVDLICLEKEVKLLPRALPTEVIDELIHWITSINTIEVRIDTKKIKRKPKTIEEVIDKLDEMGKTADREDVIAAIKRGWAEKVPNYVVVEKSYLEKLIGEPLE